MNRIATIADATTVPSLRSRRIALGVAALGLTLLAGRLTAYAGAPPTNELNGGGARWVITNTAGTDNGLPVGGACDASPGFGVSDASLPTAEQGDALDFGVTIWVDNSIFAAPGDFTTLPQSISAGPVLMSGLNTSVQYYALPDAPLLRTLATFQNPTPADRTVTITLATNIGSDARSEIATTSSGDTALTIADRWAITDDTGEIEETAPAKVGASAVADGDPANTHVLFGPGAPRVTPATVTGTVFSCAGTEGVLATFTLTVRTNETRRLMFFNGLHETSAAAIAAAPLFNTAPKLNSALLAGLSETELDQIVNWEIDKGVPLTSFLATGSGTSTVGGALRSVTVSARKDRGRAVKGSFSYANLSTGVRLRGTRITGAEALGTRGVRLFGTGRIGRSETLNFTAEIFDNQGVGPDTFRLSVSNGLIVPTTPLSTGNFRVRAVPATEEPTPG